MDKMKSLFLSSLLVVVSTSGLAQNPIIQTNYTADPAPMVYNDKVYLYTTHDEDNSTWFTTVSYTHLDVYKRQGLCQMVWSW